MTSLRLIMSDSWLDQLAYLHSSPHALTTDVDLIVDRVNLTAEFSPEPLLPFLDAWLTWIESISNHGRALLEWPDNPAEAGAVPDADRVWLSLWPLPQGAPLLLDHPIPITALLSATQDAFTHVLAHAQRHLPSLSELNQLATRAANLAHCTHKPLAPRTPEHVVSGDLSWHFTPTPALQRVDATPHIDLHPLLIPATLTRGGQPLWRGIPLLQQERPTELNVPWARLRRAFFEHLRELAPALAHNARLQRELETDARWSDTPTQPNTTTAPSPSGPVPSFPWAFSQVRALHPRQTWSWRAVGIAFDDIIAHDQDLLVPTRDALTRLSTRTGAPAWTRPHTSGVSIDPARALALLHQDDALHACDLETGEPTHTIPLESPITWSAPGQGMDVLVRTTQGVWEAREADEILWRRAAAAQERVVGRLEDRWLLSGERHIECIQGSGPVWRWEADRRIERVLHGDDVLLVMTQGGALVALDARTGTRLWHTLLEGTWTRRTRHQKHSLHACLRTHDGLEMIEVELGAGALRWRTRLPHADAWESASALSVQQGVGYVRTSGGGLYALALETGRMSWSLRTTPTPEQRVTLPVSFVRDCLLVPGADLELRLLEDGALLHRFDAMIQTPAFLSAQGALQVVLGEPDEEEDVLFGLDFGHFLAVVP